MIRFIFVPVCIFQNSLVRTARWPRNIAIVTLKIGLTEFFGPIRRFQFCNSRLVWAKGLLRQRHDLGGNSC